jgi:hypothetical protein
VWVGERAVSFLLRVPGLRYVLTPGNWLRPRVSLPDEGCNPRREGSFGWQEMASLPETGLGMSVIPLTNETLTC